MRFKFTDFHIHTRPWSVDVAEDGPTFIDYIKIVEEHQINICFLDHYELYYVENDKTNPFYNGRVDDYLEEIDRFKESYDFILSGLEIEYYEDKEIELSEFMDDYEKEFDFIGGSIHEWIIGYPITTREGLKKLLEKIPMKKIIDNYFEVSKKMIDSQIFKNICHIDTIFRYINNNEFIPTDDCNVSENRVLDLGRLCMKNRIKVELNLSGLRFPIKRTFPSMKVMQQLKKEGVEFFVGSDSHSLDYFKEQIPKVINTYKLLQQI
ncbi:MAG: histidinol-phosphatase HisJ family protein [Promethearchaeota archaeon]|nr:MAG: histidinol-phosphatase HisJ family protein [Candidatus Lokiarchaeota archaeon]